MFLRRSVWGVLLVTAGAVACSPLKGESAKEDSRELAIANEIVRTDAPLANRLAKTMHGFSEVGDAFRNASAEKSLVEGELRAKFPLQGDGSSELVTRHRTLRMRPKNARPTRGFVDGGRLVYPKAFGPSADRIVVASDLFVEEFALLRDKSAGTRLSWTLEGDSSGAQVVPADGGLTWIAADGRPILNVPKPFAVDAQGVKVSVDLTWSDATHTMTVALRDAETLSYPVLVDPVVEVAIWSNGTLPYIYDFDMAYDEARGEFVIPQGEKTALWRGEWRTIPGVGPRLRGSYGISFDELRSNVVLFGGVATGTPLNDTWVWDGASWTQAKPTRSPAARSGATMAYDRARKKVVLFGGATATARLNDTWEWDGSTWTERTPTTSPSPRMDAAMAYDEERGAMVLFGGDSVDYFANSSNAETWTWDGLKWTKLVVSTTPSSRSRASMSYDRTNKKIVLFGGKFQQSNFYADTWTLSGTTWTQLAGLPIPTGRANASIGYDTSRKRVVMLGGEMSSGILGDTGISDSWEWDGTAWTSLPTYAPFPRSGAGAAYDPVRKNTMVFGGVSVAGSPVTDETWVGDGNAFAKRAPLSHPSGRAFSALAFDRARGETVLFGGSTSFALAGSLNDTWGWNGTNWTQKHPLVSPPPLLTALAYDAERQNTVLFAGINGSGGYAADTWTWDGTEWTKRAPLLAPEARRFHAMAYDAKRKQVVLFGGQSAASVTLDDTWLWDGATWTQAVPPAKPTARAGHVMTYDDRRGVVLLWGGLSETDTWEWDGTTWSELAFTGPSLRWLPSFVYDVGRNQSMLIGGAGVFFTTVNSDTWWLNLRGGDCSADSDCDTGHCVDQTCCNVASCGTCQACNAVGREGVCSPVRSLEDKDSCSGVNSCDPGAQCKSNLGTACAVASDCAAGHCVDGVCCDSACDGTCMACRADAKASGKDSGSCDLAKVGTDLHDDCADDQAVSCQRNGACDGKGRCEIYAKGTSCGESVCSGSRAVGRVCDGISTCGESSEGVECAPYVCDRAQGGCTSTCERDIDCTGFSRCNVDTHKCVSKEGSSCDGDHTIVAPDNTPTDCGTYKCEGTECKTKCASINDCVSPAVCTAEGKCVLTGESTEPSGEEPGCSCRTGRKNQTSGSGGSIAGALLLVAGVRRWRRRATAARV